MAKVSQKIIIQSFIGGTGALVSKACIHLEGKPKNPVLRSFDVISDSNFFHNSFNEMSIKADIGFLFAFIFESIYNFFRWTPFGPKKCRFDDRLDGKVCVITGATSGIGLVVAKELAEKGAKVIIGSRDLTRAQEVCDDILKDHPSATVECHVCDLASFASVRQFVSQLQSEPHIDILVNNGSVLGVPLSKTVDGFETTFQTNYLSHFMLTLCLLDQLKASQLARVVNTVSASYSRAAPEGIDFEDFNYEKRSNYSSHLAYCRSKLALIWFTRQLATRLEATNVHIYAAYPGLSKTSLTRHITGFYGLIWKVMSFFICKGPELGSQTLLFCIADKETGRESGHYYNDCSLVGDKNLKSIATNDELARRLWDVSKSVCQLNSVAL